MSKAADLANLIGNINAGGGGVNKNLLINGSMAISQRGTSHTTATSYTLDRWNISETTDGAVTITQDSSVPTGSGLANSYKLDVTTADTSLSSAQRVFPHQIIEAQNCQILQYGTSEAKPITLSFYVKSNVTGTYTVLFYNSDASKHQSATYTIDSANTWEQKKITIQGDTASGFDDDNGAGLEISWWLAAGSAYTSGTLGTGSWQSETAANKVSSSNVNIMSSTDNEWFLTGCQLEVGQNPTEFEHEPFERTLHKCQRYYYRESLGGLGIGSSYATGAWNYVSMIIPATMRADPTASYSGGTGSGTWHSSATSKGVSGKKGRLTVYQKCNGTNLDIYVGGSDPLIPILDAEL
tara:strand:- start:96 stop:1154 length:1059 start_codon:yes stop_codon:yes gene_type:complete